MADWLPGVSQLKSLIQVAFGDKDGAVKTQRKFSKQCPVVSQVRSAYEALTGNIVAARETQKEFCQTMSGVADAIPVVGHVKGGVHYAFNDRDGGDNAMKAASRTTGAIAGGLLIGGPFGAVAGGVTGAAAMDIVTTVVDSVVHDELRQAGYIQQIPDVIRNPTDIGKLFDTAFMVVGDGATGYVGRKPAKNLGRCVKKHRGTAGLMVGCSAGAIAGAIVATSGPLPVEERFQEEEEI